jgi:hypothetical protein
MEWGKSTMLKLLPPGTRKRNPFWIVRGRDHGRRIEASTKTADRERAEAFLVDYRRRLTDDRRRGTENRPPAAAEFALHPRPQPAARPAHGSGQSIATLLERLLAAELGAQAQLAEITELLRAQQAQPNIREPSAPDQKGRGASYQWEALLWRLVDALANELGRTKTSVRNLMIELGQTDGIAVPSPGTVTQRQKAALKRIR